MAFVNNQVISIVKRKPGISTPPPTPTFVLFFPSTTIYYSVYVCIYQLWLLGTQQLTFKDRRGKERDVLNHSRVALIHYAD